MKCNVIYEPGICTPVPNSMPWAIAKEILSSQFLIILIYPKIPALKSSDRLGVSPNIKVLWKHYNANY
jgi:hypothetical protein